MKKIRLRCVSLSIFVACTLFFAAFGHAKPTVQLMMRPDLEQINLDSWFEQDIKLIARVSEEVDGFRWKLDGPGRLEQQSSRKVQYIPPERLEKSPAKVIFSVSVNNNGETITQQKTLTLTAKDKLIKPDGKGNAKLLVQLRMVPDLEKVDLDTFYTPEITLIARVNMEGVKYRWTMDGPGSLAGDRYSRKIRYTLPEELPKSPTKIVFSVNAFSEGETITKRKTLILTAKEKLIGWGGNGGSTTGGGGNSTGGEAIQWECINPDESWQPSYSYELGAFLHYGTAKSIRDYYWSRGEEKLFRESVAVSLVPYIRAKEDGKEYILVRSSADDDFSLACGNIGRDYIVNNFSAELYPEVWLTPQDASLQKKLSEEYLPNLTNHEFLTSRIEFAGIHPTKMEQLLETLTDDMQKATAEIPFLAGWKGGSIDFEKFVGFQKISQFSYNPEPPKPKNFLVTLQLPEQFRQLRDISENIHLGECVFTRSDRKPEIYAASCPEPVTADANFSIDGFSFDDDATVVPGEHIILSAEILLADFTFFLPEYTRRTYYVAITPIRVEPGKPLTGRISLKTFSQKNSFALTLQVTEGKRPKGERKPEWRCDFERHVSLDEFGKTIVLEPPCRENIIKFAEGIPLPERVEPCVTTPAIGNGIVSCLRKTGEDLTIFWKEDEQIETQKISAAILDTPRVIYTVDSFKQSFYTARLILPEFFQEDISDWISLPGCEKPTFQEGNRYRTECERSSFSKLNSLEIKDLLTLPLEKTFIEGQYISLRGNGSNRSIPVSVMLSDSSDLSYRVNKQLVQPGQPFEYQMSLEKPSIRFSTSDPRYAECSFDASLHDMGRVLRHEAFEVTPPCRLNTLSWPADYLGPMIEGCLKQTPLTENSVTCLRREETHLIVRWSNDDAGIVYDAEKLNNMQAVEISPPSEHFSDKIPAKIDTAQSNLPFGFDKKFLLFPTRESCETAEIANIERNVAQYTAATVKTLWAGENDWAVVARGDTRLSKCVQGRSDGSHMLFSFKADEIAEKRLVIAIENSKYLADMGRGNALKEGLFIWLAYLKDIGKELPLTLFQIMEDGRLIEIIRGEELQDLPLLGDADSPSLYAKLHEAFNFRDAAFQPLRSFDRIALHVQGQKLAKVLYFSDGRGLPDPINASHVGTLLMWKYEAGTEVLVMTSNSCEKWANDKFVNCRFFQENPTQDDVVSILRQIENE